ncbi:MAG: cytochrome c oxidase subunit II [Dehalococcoidia bacterium]|nr:cytochrome c oxidase subunit II [Dehalococcoidia bacterium]
MRRDLIIAGIIWAVATALAVAATYYLLDPFPTHGAEEATLVDDAFFTLTYMATPVFGLVIAGLGYSLMRFRAKGDPTEDGPPISGGLAIPVAWLIVTTTLAVVVMIHPGLTGLFELRADNTADLQVNVTGFRWAWTVEYPESGVRVSSPVDELVLPAHRRIQFNVTSIEGDVLHAFWVPAFRVKADAVPGQVIEVFVTLDRTSDPDDIAYRVQCTELCGLFHAGMAMDVRVVEPEEFDAWVESKTASVAKVQ